jgi:hypothetical protein
MKVACLRRRVDDGQVQSTVAARPGQLRNITISAKCAVRPNTSLNHRTRYGGPSWPGLGYAVHFPSPGQAVPPQRSG